MTVLISQTHDVIFERRAALGMEENSTLRTIISTFTIQTLCFTG